MFGDEAVQRSISTVDVEKSAFADINLDGMRDGCSFHFDRLVHLRRG